MKHKAILYTCTGLMAAAAVMGFADYHYASKAGLFDELYAEDEQVTQPSASKEKQLDMEDYSRAAFEYPDEQRVLTAALEDEDNTLSEELPPPPPPAPAPPAEPFPAMPPKLP